MAKNLADDLQTRIVRELTSSRSQFQWAVRYSYASLARKLGVGKEMVRTRLRQASEAGFIEGWQLMLNPHLIGRNSAVLVLDFQEAKRKPIIISQIELIEGVVLVLDYLDGGLRVVLYYETEEELERKIRLISSICGCDDPISWKVGYPRCNLRLKRTDWEIVRELRKNPKRRLSDVASELRISVRTVKRRLSKMIEDNAFYLFPKTNPKRFPSTGFIFLIRYSNEEKKSIGDEFLSSKLGRIVYADTIPKQYSTFSVACKNFSEADEIFQLIRGLDGVEDVRMNIIKEIIHVHSWFDDEIGKRLSQSK